jgi:predicted alpha/beta-fold hydrolase
MGLIALFLLLLLAALVLFVLRRLFRRCPPQVHVNPDGEMFAIVSSMSSLKRPYCPTPWLPEQHSQTMWGMRFRRTHLDYRRELFDFSDGGRCALDFYDPPDDVSDPPILMIIHTLAGGTREPCSNNLCHAARRSGFRAFVFNNRGCSGVDFKSRRFYNALRIDDIQAVIEHVRRQYNPRWFFLHGFSLGAYMSIRYGVFDGGVDAISCASHTYNGIVANRCLLKFVQKRLYLPVMMEKLIRLLRKNPFVSHPAALKAKTLDEYDREYTQYEENIPDISDYYREVSIHHNIPKLKTKTLLLGADNDPFTEARTQPREEAEASMNCAFVHVAEGGHVSFPMGFRADKSLMDVVILDFYRTVMNIVGK